MPTLDQAIKTVEFEDRATGRPRNNDFWDAVRLCVFAAKGIDAWRNNNDNSLLWNLPGETEE